MRFLRLLSRRWTIQCVPEHPGTVRAVRFSLGFMASVLIFGMALWLIFFILWFGAHTLKETYQKELHAAQTEIKQQKATIQALSGESERLRQENAALRNEYADLAKRLSDLEDKLRDHQEKIDAAMHPRAEKPAFEPKGSAQGSVQEVTTTVQKATDRTKMIASTAHASSLKTVSIAALKSELFALEAKASEQEAALPVFIEKVERIRDDLERTPSIQPASGRITSVFGYRIDPFTHTKHLHEGIDFANVRGTKVVAAARGEVIFAGYNGSYGLQIAIQHKPGLKTTYSHLSKIDVKVGDNVEKGERIGLMGSTGRSTGSHLHYEVHVDGRSVDPAAYLGGTIRVEEALYQD
ncbi:MAG: metalloendopeptidase [Candidatus Carbobacillus altaicus]|uniref:Metalloendopeptidase n=1 Tax=Candidatus Carbonibacillus altaicus TaxID=2163959 RepID=A0A2R6Y472_9BACL|nr:MAG: metalloendopeptidase [Candidatus Carbobacillus altaicus]